MTKLTRREFQEMKKKALTQLRHLALGYDIEPSIDDEGCLRLCKGYEKIEVLDVPQIPFRTFTGKEVLIKNRIVVQGNGGYCFSICPSHAESLENYINILNDFVKMIACLEYLKYNPSAFNKEKIVEAYSAVLNLKAYLSKLLPFTQS
ncbi:hypothetical protein [Sulfolobus monocaudavirus SMV4]|uniref:hypothetical protein n=1 Tax=Sulfolobus monocaudavirus SMV4 TaxID=1732178 RepID=UPI0007066513|nr:hypothetical protein AVT99_gp40 [Sulfolobus monocaudavirus SMV4]ALG97064.1 hypothetical protein [Sulfolobus monocaudavirus SMV4]